MDDHLPLFSRLAIVFPSVLRSNVKIIDDETTRVTVRRASEHGEALFIIIAVVSSVVCCQK